VATTGKKTLSTISIPLYQFERFLSSIFFMKCASFFYTGNRREEELGGSEAGLNEDS
jgi:hypothetical protein